MVVWIMVVEVRMYMVGELIRRGGVWRRGGGRGLVKVCDVGFWGLVCYLFIGRGVEE